MALASIDIDKLQAVISALNDDSTHLWEDHRTLLNQLDQFGLSTHPAVVLDNIGACSSHASLELAKRLATAQKVAAANPSLTTVTINDIPYESSQLPSDPAEALNQPMGTDTWWDQFWDLLDDLLADIVNFLATVGGAMLDNPKYTFELIAGLLLILLGGGGEGAGTALDLTGIGAIIGIPINILSAALVAAGVGLAAAGISQIAIYAKDHPRTPVSKSTGGSGGWSPPTKVNGYLPHAITRMQQRNITRGMVEDLVDNPQEPPKWQPGRGTWLYKRGTMCVAVYPDGRVKTVFWT